MTHINKIRATERKKILKEILFKIVFTIRPIDFQNCGNVSFAPGEPLQAISPTLKGSAHHGGWTTTDEVQKKPGLSSSSK